jgi:hypothetical protein
MITNLSPDEQHLHDYMERSLTDVLGDAPRLEARAVSRGRTLRRRRRVGTGLAGAAVVATVAAFVVPATMGDSGARQSDHFADTTEDAQPPTGPTTLPEATGWWDMPSPEVHDRLAPLLPGAVAIDDYEVAPDDRAPGEPAESSGWLHATLATAEGQTGGFEILMYPPDVDAEALDPDPATNGTATPSSGTDTGTETETEVFAGSPANEQRISCPADLGAAKTCTEIETADGAHVGRLYTWTMDGLLYREVAMMRDGGAVFFAATANSTDDKWGFGSTVSSDEPPLTLAELRAIAESDTWTDWAPPAQ